MKIAFVTCSGFADGRADDQQVARIVGADFEVWDDPAVDWHAYQRVIIRSIWDYSSRPEQFLSWCDRVGPERLRNSPRIVHWNSDKLYLRELPVPTVPTQFLSPGTPLPKFSGEIVIKPNVSAGGRDTGRFTADAVTAAAELVATIHASDRTALMQPYLPGVDAAGETAVVILGGKVSHVLAKKPVLRTPGIAPLGEGENSAAKVMYDDDLVTAGVATPEQLRLALDAHGAVSARVGSPLYLRVDMVPGVDGNPVVIELEAMEPRLYLELHEGAVTRFADVIRADLAA